VTVVRRVLDNAAARSLATRHAEAWYVATVLATAAASWALLTIARALNTTLRRFVPWLAADDNPPIDTAARLGLDDHQI